jgi:hypothetical protein
MMTAQNIARVPAKLLARAVNDIAVEVVSSGDLFTAEERARAFQIGSVSALGDVPTPADLAFLGNAYSRLLRVGGAA